MDQLILAREFEEMDIDVPPLEINPIPHSIGQVRHVLASGGVFKARQVGDAPVSSRRKDPLYELASGEKAIVTTRSKTIRSAGVDGALRRMPNGKYKWLWHRRLDAFHKRVDDIGWPAVVAEVAAAWIGAFSFRAEQIDAGGNVISGKEGLRPPQLGALHAIGAHWSLSHQPATIVMPTGTGKTETILSVLVAYGRGPLLVVVPSDVLRTQTARKFLTLGLLRKLKVLAPDVPNPIVGIITRRPRSAADLEMFRHCNVIVGTMSALGDGAAVALTPQIAECVDALVVDEAHHVGAEGWSTFRAAFGARRVIQFTATPFRRDGKIVDGSVIYNYPLRVAQQDGYFKPISFEPIYEMDGTAADNLIAKATIDKLRSDLASGFNHLAMARCRNIERATQVHAIYQALAPDLRPMLVHSELGSTDDRLEELRSGKSRVVVCVNMLGEGFDLPELKIAAVHDLHKSLTVLLQFVGRFTRSAGRKIGNATAIANIADPDVSQALERLYSEDADWNQLLSELSSDAAREHAELVHFLQASKRLDEADETEKTPISHQLLRPTLSTLIYEADDFRPKKFHEGLPQSMEVHRVWLHEPSETLFFVTRFEPYLKWTRSRALRDRQWGLFVLHYDRARRLLFLSSTDHSSPFEKLAKAVGAGRMISGDVIFRTLGRINRLIFQNVGVKKHGRRNLRYAMYTGADVAEALSLSERAGSVKSNLNGTGWEDGKSITIGCSYKGRVWSQEHGPIPRFVKWCGNVGSKLVDGSIDTREIIANVLIPEEQDRLPAKEILGLEWPYELIKQSEERITLSRDGNEQPLSMFDLQIISANLTTNTLEFHLIEALTGEWASLTLAVGGAEGFRVNRLPGTPVTLNAGSLTLPIEEYLSNYPPLVRFVDLTELDGNLLIQPQHAQQLSIGEDRFEPWDWTDVDMKKESIWKDGSARSDSIQWRAAKHFIDGGFDIVFDDDSAGEAADLVCLKEAPDHIRLALVHCKFSGATEAGERVKDVVEVCSQAVRSSKWKWKFRDLCRHIAGREKRLATQGRNTRFLAGRPNDITHFLKASRFKEIRPEIIIVQPGLSQSARTAEQSAVLAAALNYIKQTIGVDLDIVCSR